MAAALRKSDDVTGVLAALGRVELLVRAAPDELAVQVRSWVSQQRLQQALVTEMGLSRSTRVRGRLCAEQRGLCTHECEREPCTLTLTCTHTRQMSEQGVSARE